MINMTSKLCCPFLISVAVSSYSLVTLSVLCIEGTCNRLVKPLVALLVKHGTELCFIEQPVSECRPNSDHTGAGRG